MPDPIFDAVPGTRRWRAEVEARRRQLGQAADRNPADAAVQGALAAARWTLGESGDAPLSPGRGADRAGVEAELDLARAIVLGLRPGDRERAAGVREWLEWWL